MTPPDFEIYQYEDIEDFGAITLIVSQEPDQTGIALKWYYFIVGPQYEYHKGYTALDHSVPTPLDDCKGIAEKAVSYRLKCFYDCYPPLKEINLSDIECKKVERIALSHRHLERILNDLKNIFLHETEKNHLLRGSLMETINSCY